MKRSALVLMIVCILIVSISYGVLAQEKQDLEGKEFGPWDYISSGEEWEPVTTVTNIGVLRGSFYEIGFQYGQRVPYGTSYNADVEWSKSLAKYETVEAVKAELALYLEQLKSFSPQTVQFLEGLADGAAHILEQSPYANDGSTNFDRIFNLNTAPYFIDPVRDHGCNGVWLGKEATKDGRAIYIFESQGGAMGTDRWGRKVIFIAIPDDPNAHTLWVYGGAGCIGRGGVILNDAGVVSSLFNSDERKFKEEVDDYGLEGHAHRFHTALYGGSAEEAAEIITLGTPEYREITGRETLLRSKGDAIMLGDANSGLVVEYTAHRYAIRRPGDMGEIDSAYICQSNHNFSEYSMDDNNERSDVPMTKYAPEVKDSSSYYRFWSPMWYIRNNYGEITIDMALRELAALHDRYDEDGNKLDYKRGSTFCTHKFDSAGNPGGSHGVAVVIPETLEAFTIPCWPCRFVDEDWSYYNLNDYLSLR